MLGVKNPVIYAVKRISKKFYILAIILLVGSSCFPPLGFAELTLHPDLMIVSVTVPETAVEGDTVLIKVVVKNIGHADIVAGERINVSLFLDDEISAVVIVTDTLGLKINKTRQENLSWKATLGETFLRILHLKVSFSGTEENTNNNMAVGEILVNERTTDLTFATTPTIGGMLLVGKPVTILATIKNTGKNTTQDINVSLYIDQVLRQWHVRSGGLIKGNTYEVSFIWTPGTLGTHQINVTIDPKRAIVEQVETNNFFKVNRVVSVPWWNTSWHYRRVYNMTGAGNYSASVNFTSLLQSLQVSNKEFDNTTIRVVRYYTANGTMVPVSLFWFNESTAFHNRTNALGVLTWKVSGASLYCVYFDVKENRGARLQASETVNMTQSGTVSLLSTGSAEGWWTAFTVPFSSYYLPSTLVSIPVSTSAEAKNVTARFSRNGAYHHITPLLTGDNCSWLNSSSFVRGNWTVNVTSYDDAGYRTIPLLAEFSVGYPDLSVTALDAPPIGYVGYDVTVTASVCAFNTTVDHVNVSLLINGIVKSVQRNLTIQKDENRTVQLIWRPQSKGQQNITVTVDPLDSTPKNNKRWKNITIEGVPDLDIVNVTITPFYVDEGNPVTVITHITNTGDGNATGYEVRLYCEQNENNHTMYFHDEKNHTTVSLKKGASTNVSLIWFSAEYGISSFKGEWAVGVQIMNTPTTPLKDEDLNQKALFHSLYVNQTTPVDTDTPAITILSSPSTQEQGYPVTIIARVTDQSDIASVDMTITNPQKNVSTFAMTPQLNHQYSIVFSGTSIIGRYNYSITAKDIYGKTSTLSSTFTITIDKTPPTIEYSGAIPSVQLYDEEVEIRCITTDFSLVHSVTVTIFFPDASSEEKTMINASNDTKYVYTQSYNIIGKYVYFITAEDTLGNTIHTKNQTFWMTTDLNDTDADGMPDAWEERYGLNPYDPNDATLDADDDGVTNLSEYKDGTNPLKRLSSASELFARLRENWAYLLASVIIVLVIIGLSLYGIRRRRQ